MGAARFGGHERSWLPDGLGARRAGRRAGAEHLATHNAAFHASRVPRGAVEQLT